MQRFLDAVDAHVERAGLAVEVLARGPTGARGAARPRRTRLDLRAEGIGTVVLATGYRPHFPWLRAAGPRPRAGPSGSTAA